MFTPEQLITLVVEDDAGSPAGKVTEGIGHSSSIDGYLHGLNCSDWY